MEVIRKVTSKRPVMKKQLIATFVLGTGLGAVAVGLVKKGDSVQNIEHILNADEMEATPQELYFFTAKGKYLFDGETVEFITDYPKQ